MDRMGDYAVRIPTRGRVLLLTSHGREFSDFGAGPNHQWISAGDLSRHYQRHRYCYRPVSTSELSRDGQRKAWAGLQASSTSIVFDGGSSLTMRKLRTSPARIDSVLPLSVLLEPPFHLDWSIELSDDKSALASAFASACGVAF